MTTKQNALDALYYACADLAQRIGQDEYDLMHEFLERARTGTESAAQHSVKPTSTVAENSDNSSVGRAGG
jgi:hypothetical protein